jgi:hypothetical protein
VIRTTWRPLGRAVALAASLALLVIGVAAPAHARPLEEQSGEEHCVVLLDDDAADSVACAGTIEAAVQKFTAETGYTVSETADEVGPLVVYTLARLYADANYGGSSYLFTRSTACNGVTLSSVPDLGVFGLSDAVSSFLTYSTCTVRLYVDVNYGGSTYGYTTTQSSLPTFNDVATSARAR